MRVKKSKDGETEISGSIATSAQLGKLGLYVEEQLRRMVRELASGNIDADPWAQRAGQRLHLLRIRARLPL